MTPETLIIRIGCFIAIYGIVVFGLWLNEKLKEEEKQNDKGTGKGTGKHN